MLHACCYLGFENQGIHQAGKDQEASVIFYDKEINIKVNKPEWSSPFGRLWAVRLSHLNLTIKVDRDFALTKGLAKVYFN